MHFKFDIYIYIYLMIDAMMIYENHYKVKLCRNTGLYY